MDFSKIRNYIFLGLLLVVTFVFFLLLRPFAYPLFWAAVIAALFYPFYQRLDSYLRHPNLSTTLTLMSIVVIIIVPLIIVGKLVIFESVNLYTKFNLTSINSVVVSLSNTVKHNALTARFNINETFLIEKISEAARAGGTYLLGVASDLTQNSLKFILMFVIMLYALFFLIRDGEKLLKKLMYLCPLGDRYEILLYHKFTTTAAATLKGTLVIGLIQGSLGGILFALLGIPGAIIWGLVMAVFSLIPGLGSFIVWGPAAIILFLLGQIWQAIIIVLVGTLIIGTIDNFLRPSLVGKGLHMHPLLIIFSTLGGAVVFGISGFIIGPIMASLFLAFWEMYEEYYHTELDHN